MTLDSLRVDTDDNGGFRFACSLCDMTGQWVTPNEAELQVQMHKVSNKHKALSGEA
jgi:hypothetical protein